MSDLIVTKTRIRAGIWEGVVDWPGAENGQAPAIVVQPSTLDPLFVQV